MKLDSRILKGKKPLDCFDAENKELIKPFLNKEGYFSNNIENFCLLGRCSKRLLSNVFKERKSCFTDDEGGDWKFFLPVEWVKEPEKKYRPFKDHTEYKEYLNDGIIESWIQIREKLTGEVSELMYVGGSGAIICLGAYSFDLNNLFYDFELFNKSTGEWQPFGVIDEQGAGE